MNDRPRIPHGVAKRILVAMKPSDTCKIRPEYAESFRAIAQRLGFHVSIKPIGYTGRLCQMKRVESTTATICGIPIRVVPAGVLPDGVAIFGYPSQPNQCAILKHSA